MDGSLVVEIWYVDNASSPSITVTASKSRPTNWNMQLITINRTNTPSIHVGGVSGTESGMVVSLETDTHFVIGGLIIMGVATSPIIFGASNPNFVLDSMRYPLLGQKIGGADIYQRAINPGSYTINSSVSSFIGSDGWVTAAVSIKASTSPFCKCPNNASLDLILLDRTT